MADKSKGKMSTADAIALVTRKKAHKTGKPKTIKDNSQVKISESVNNSEIISVNNKLEICESQPIDIKNEMTCEWKSNMVPVVAIQNGPTCFNATLTG